MDQYDINTASDPFEVNAPSEFKLVGIISIPAISFGGDTITYRGRAEKLFYSVTGWDSEQGKPIGEIPKLYVKWTGFNVLVQDEKGKVLKSMTARITRVYGYTVESSGEVYLKFQFDEVGNGVAADTLHRLDPVPFFIHKDPQSDLLAVVLSGYEKTCMRYVTDKMTVFVHGDTMYYMKSAFKFTRAYKRTLDGTDHYETLGIICIAHPDIAVENFDEKMEAFTEHVTKLLSKMFGVVFAGQ